MHFHPVAVRRTRAIAWSSGWLALLIGATGVFGAVTGDRMLQTGFTGLISMKVNTGATLCLSALALLLRLGAPAHAVFRRVADLFACTAIVVGSATLSEHLFGWNLGIDQLLLRDLSDLYATTQPGRMGPPATLCFIALGTALLLLDRSERLRALPQWLALSAAGFAGLSLFGYLTQAAQLYGIARYTGIALHTALGLAALALGVCLARPTRGPVAIVLADNAGGQLARNMLPLTILLPALIGWLCGVGEKLGWYDRPFGRALLLLSLTTVFTTLVWTVALRFSSVADARTSAEQATNRARAEAQRLMSENLRTLSLLESLFTHAPVGLSFFDHAGRCVRVNAYTAALHSGAPEALLGRALHDVLPGRAPGSEEALSRALSSGASTMNLEIVRPASQDGAQEERSWLGGFFPVHDPDGAVRKAGCIMLDSSERRRLEAQRSLLLDSERAARTEAERAAALKDQFLATLSHELRTPLNAIMGWVVLARRSPALPQELERPLEIIERNARLQVQLIEDLLDISSIVSGKLHLETAIVELRPLLQSALLAITPAAEARQVRLESELPDAAISVVGDPARLAQIVSNLLSNAVKFTPQGGRVSLRAEAAAGRVEISVSDSGVGIAAEFLPHVFDRFRQADATTTRRHGGLGLGLSIVRQLTELHGGSVRAQSAGENRGATFVVTLPLAAVALQPQASAPSSLIRSSLRDVRVLVVDDEADARDFVARVLADNEASVETVGGAAEALQSIERNKPDVLISDIGMPGMDGYDLIRSVRTKHDAATLPAIALTAFARTDDRSVALRSGFQLHIAKPVDPYELSAAVADLVRRGDVASQPASDLHEASDSLRAG